MCVKRFLLKKTLWLGLVLTIIIIGGSVAASELPFKGVSLKFFTMNTLTPTPEMVEKWEARTGAKVNIVEVPYTVMREKLLLEMTSRSGTYDVLMADECWMPEFGNAGYVVPLDRFIERDKEKIDWEDFDQHFVQMQCQYPPKTGQIIGVPIIINFPVIAYNTYMLREIGVDEFPGELDTFANVCAKLTRDTNSDGKIDVWAFAPIFLKGDALFCAFLEWYGSFTGHGMLDDNNYPLLDTDEALEVVTYLQKLTPYMPPGFLNFRDFEALEAFKAQTVAMAHTWWLYGADLLNPDLNPVAKHTEFELFPGRPGKSAFTAAWMLSIPIGAKHVEASWDLVKWLTSKEFMRHEILAQKTSLSVCSGRLSVMRDPEILAVNPVLGLLEGAFASQVHKPRVPELERVQDALTDQVAMILAGELTPKQGSEAMQKNVYEILKAGGRIK